MVVEEEGGGGAGFDGGGTTEMSSGGGGLKSTSSGARCRLMATSGSMLGYSSMTIACQNSVTTARGNSFSLEMLAMHTVSGVTLRCTMSCKRQCASALATSRRIEQKAKIGILRRLMLAVPLDATNDGHLVKYSRSVTG